MAALPFDESHGCSVPRRSHGSVTNGSSLRCGLMPTLAESRPHTHRGASHSAIALEADHDVRVRGARGGVGFDAGKGSRPTIDRFVQTPASPEPDATLRTGYRRKSAGPVSRAPIAGHGAGIDNCRSSGCRLGVPCGPLDPAHTPCAHGLSGPRVAWALCARCIQGLGRYPPIGAVASSRFVRPDDGGYPASAAGSAPGRRSKRFDSSLHGLRRTQGLVTGGRVFDSDSVRQRGPGDAARGSCAAPDRRYPIGISSARSQRQATRPRRRRNGQFRSAGPIAIPLEFVCTGGDRRPGAISARSRAAPVKFPGC